MRKNLDDKNQMFLGITIELYPTEEQSKRLEEFIYASNYIYDIGLKICDDKYIDYMNEDSEQKRISTFDAERYIREFRKNDIILSNIPSHICAEALHRVLDSYNMYINHLSNKPKYRLPDNMTPSFDVRSDSFSINNGFVKMEGFTNKPIHNYCLGEISCQNLGFCSNDKFYGVTVYRNIFGNYFISASRIVNRIAFDYPKTKPIGIDIGYRLDGSNTIVCSNGIIYHQPNTEHLQSRIRYFQELVTEDRLKRTSDKLSNRELENIYKFRMAHKKLSNVLDTFYNQATADIIKRNPEAIIIEDCFANNIKQSNSYINYGVTYSSKIREMIIYKARLHKIPVYIANKGYKSSYICSNCGRIRYTPLERTKIFKCENPNCNCQIDRDLNASINLENLYNYRHCQINYNHMIKDIIV